LSVQRHYFPGNNTPLGFFSYYKYILGQREANRIICIKGGPGTGKSTFMKKIGEYFSEKGEDIDFLHCSADENSLDGIVIKNKKIALIDGTSPHITDPITPGAVDRIVNLGEYWNEEGIAVNKNEIIDLNEETSRWYRIAYNYLNAAKSVFRSLEEVYSQALEASEIYRVIADIVEREYGEYDISLRPGKVKKFFASGITATGNVNYITSLLGNMEKIYMINVPVGYSNTSLMEIVSEGAVYRGFDIETYYCAMSPEEKIEHIIIPELKTAFISVNRYHDVEPWEIVNVEGKEQQIAFIDMNDYMDSMVLQNNEELIETLNDEYDILLNNTVKYLSKAKEAHLMVESMYIPNMNFTQIGALIEELETELDK
jgi:hypothetical protein